MHKIFNKAIWIFLPSDTPFEKSIGDIGGCQIYEAEGVIATGTRIPFLKPLFLKLLKHLKYLIPRISYRA